MLNMPSAHIMTASFYFMHLPLCMGDAAQFSYVVLEDTMGSLFLLVKSQLSPFCFSYRIFASGAGEERDI